MPLANSCLLICIREILTPTKTLSQNTNENENDATMTTTTTTTTTVATGMTTTTTTKAETETTTTTGASSATTTTPATVTTAAPVAPTTDVLQTTLRLEGVSIGAFPTDAFVAGVASVLGISQSSINVRAVSVASSAGRRLLQSNSLEVSFDITTSSPAETSTLRQKLEAAVADGSLARSLLAQGLAVLVSFPSTSSTPATTSAPSTTPSGVTATTAGATPPTTSPGGAIKDNGKDEPVSMAAAIALAGGASLFLAGAGYAVYRVYNANATSSDVAANLRKGHAASPSSDGKVPVYARDYAGVGGYPGAHVEDSPVDSEYSDTLHGKGGRSSPNSPLAMGRGDPRLRKGAESPLPLPSHGAAAMLRMSAEQDLRASGHLEREEERYAREIRSYAYEPHRSDRQEMQAPPIPAGTRNPVDAPHLVNPTFVPEPDRMRFQHRNPARLDPLGQSGAGRSQSLNLRSSGDLPPLRDPSAMARGGPPPPRGGGLGGPARRLDL